MLFGVRQLLESGRRPGIWLASLLLFCGCFLPIHASGAALRMVLVADIHYPLPDKPDCTSCTEPREALMRELNTIEKKIKPDVVVFVGDAIAGEGASDLNATQTLELNQRFKSMVEKVFTRPHLHVWGNHDGPNFQKVYGYKNKSVIMGGYQLYLLGIEYNNYYAGMGEFTAWDEFDAAMKANGDKTTIAFIHNPIYPLPTFDNALKMKKFIEKYPQLKVVFQGHVHSEKIMKNKGILYVTLDENDKPYHPFYEADFDGNKIKIIRYELKDGKYVKTTVWDGMME